MKPADNPPSQEIHRLRDLSAVQWRSGIAAWLGWMFDGLDMHLYTLVAVPFVAQLLGVGEKAKEVGTYSAVIQASFLLGWALGGGFFGRIGDRLGRSRALVLTILTYAVFTGLSAVAQTWWHLLVFRFLAALGIGGEWAVGAALLSETWPKQWRPWIAATLQTAVNFGILVAAGAFYVMSGLPYRYVFLVGILPALVTLWIRRAVPETETWQTAKHAAGQAEPSVLDLFRGDVRRTTVLTILVCALSLTAHWAFVFFSVQQLRGLPEVASLDDQQRGQLVSQAFALLMIASIVGNFLAAAIARRIGYRQTIASMCLVYFAVMAFTYYTVRDYRQIVLLWTALGACSGLFALFTMYMPPLFPTLLRTTGAGFCYNIGRIAAAAGTVFFGLFSQVNDFRTALFYSGFLFIPAGLIAWFLPDVPDERARVAPVD